MRMCVACILHNDTIPLILTLKRNSDVYNIVIQIIMILNEDQLLSILGRNV